MEGGVVRVRLVPSGCDRIVSLQRRSAVIAGFEDVYWWPVQVLLGHRIEELVEFFSGQDVSSSSSSSK